MYECDDKMVSHPSHYQTSSGLEAIDVIAAFTENLNGIEAVDTANIIKYALRWKGKNGKQDLKKVIWYATHLIEHLEEEERRSFVTGTKDRYHWENNDGPEFPAPNDTVDTVRNSEFYIKESK